MGTGVELKFLFFPPPWMVTCLLLSGFPAGKVQPSRARGPEQALRTRHTATCIQRGAQGKSPHPRSAAMPTRPWDGAWAVTP